MKKTRVEVGVHVVHEHFMKVPPLCTLCGAWKLSAKSAKKHKEKHSSSKLNVTMMFTGTKQKVELTSKHMNEVPAEPKINYVDQSEQVSEQPQKRRASLEPEEPNKAKVRTVTDFDVVSPPTSPNKVMSLSQTAQQTHHPPMRVPHQHQVIPSKMAVLWKVGLQYSNRRSNYMRETF